MYPKHEEDERDCCWRLRYKYDMAVTQSYQGKEKFHLIAKELEAYNELIEHKRSHQKRWDNQQGESKFV